MQVEWRGNQYTNKSSRRGYKPLIIVNHVVSGSGQSCDNWFRSSGNNTSSANYCIWEDGRITQYVDLKDMAWAQGLSQDAIKYATAPIIKEMGVNPNYYGISIEHAGHTGKLTDAQFKATVWLHKHIQSEVKRIYGHTIPLDEKHVLGHFQIDPKRKPNCPGRDFPWKGLYNAIKEQPKQEKQPQYAETIVYYNSNAIKGLINSEGVTYVQLRELADLIGVQIGYDSATNTVTFNDKVVKPLIIDGRSYMPVRSVCEDLGMTVNWDGKNVHLIK